MAEVQGRMSVAVSERDLIHSQRAGAQGRLQGAQEGLAAATQVRA
jgi:hypothetical protein